MRTIAANYLFPVSGDPIKNGYVVLDDTGTVTEIGQLAKEKANTEFYNGILSPGFVNAHCHSELSYLQGVFTPGGGMRSFLEQITAYRGMSTPEEREYKLKVAFSQMYEEGIVAIADISNGSGSFETKRQSPIYTKTFIELFGSEPEKADTIFCGGMELVRQAANMGLDASLTPHAYYTMSEKLFDMTCAEGLKSGIISCHSDESYQERELMLYGKGALADRYRKLRLPAPSPGKAGLEYLTERILSFAAPPVEENIILVHNLATPGKSIEKAKEYFRNLYFALCPLSNIFIHNMLPKIGVLKKAEATICIGTDSLSSNRQLSMMEEIKSLQQNFKNLSTNELLLWATLNGAKAIGKEKIFGSFEVGKRPGVVLIENIDWRTLSLTPESRSRRIA